MGPPGCFDGLASDRSEAILKLLKEPLGHHQWLGVSYLLSLQ